MATKDDSTSFDDLMPVNASNDNDDDGETLIKLDPGDSLIGSLRFVESDVGKYNNDMLHLTREGDDEAVKHWSNDTIRKSLKAADVKPGDVIGLRKESEPYTFEDDDGKEQRAHGYEVAVSEGGN